MQRIVLGMITALALGAMTASAAGPKTATAATIQLNVPTGSIAAFTSASDEATIWPALGDSVTFSVTYPKAVEKYGPRIQVMCYQDGALVYGEAAPYYQSFLIGGAWSLWQADQPPADRESAAHCVADLYYWSYQGGQKFNWLASVEFDAAGSI
jgi:hypothetical protein